MVQYNNFNSLDGVIKSNKVDLKSIQNKADYLIPTAIKYRSKECFDLLVDSKFFDPTNSNSSGIVIALDYYCNANNETNSHYINRLKNKGVVFSSQAIKQILNSDCYDEFSNNILSFINENPNINYKLTLNMSVNNMNSFKKIINIGLTMDLLNENLAYEVICRSPKDKKIMILFEFINNGINVLNNKDHVMRYFFDNFSDTSSIKYLVESVNKYNPTLDLSDLLDEYIKSQPQSWYNQLHEFSAYLYNIYINFDQLLKLNCNFFEKNNILETILNCYVINVNKSKCGYGREFDMNEILLITKLFDLFFDKGFINNNIKIKLDMNLEHFTKTYKNSKNTKYDTRNIQFMLYFLKYLENKGIQTNNYQQILAVEIPAEAIVMFSFPRKIKAIKF